MADDQPTTEQEIPAAEPASSVPPPDESPLSVGTEEDPFAERPEAYVGAAFVGGLALALILRRFAR
jgi:hypothetical protein